MKLASLLQPEFIACGEPARTYEEGRDLLLRRMAERGGVKTALLSDAIKEREALCSVIIAPGIAFPHARVSELNDFFILIGSFPEGLTVAGETEPVRLIIVYLMPEGMSNLYLRVMSAMARFLSAPGALDQLVQAATPQEFISRIAESQIRIKDIVTARDIMNPTPVVAGADTTLRKAADLMVKHKVESLAVVDDSGLFLGLVRARSLLHIGIPHYLLNMGSLDFLNDFEPFQELLKKENSMRVSEIMEAEVVRFEADTPMIQIAVTIVKNGPDCIVIVDEKGYLIGTVSALDFVHKVVRV